MRILFLTGSPARYMAPPSLADEQINAGPDWEDAADEHGAWRSLATPAGDFDLAPVLARLGDEQKPDAVVALVDSARRCVPRNLGGFAGPKVLLIADTHHLQSPLIGLINYAATEPFDRLVLLYDRHHAEFLRAAGLQNVRWLPGLTFPHDDATVRAARKARREPRLAFVGQAGKHHPRRARLLDALARAGLPVKAAALTQRAGLAHYGASLAGFNASLNGDLNLRTFEILAAGAALVTDRLAPEAGLEFIGAEGRDYLAYGDADELVERVRAALADPARTAEIGARGAAWFDRNFSAEQRRRRFTDLVFDNREAPELALPAEGPRVFFGGNTDRLLEALTVYEGVQELHRTQESVVLATAPGVAPEIAWLHATLPRVRTIPAAEADVPDLLAFSRNAPEAALTTGANRLWCTDAQPQDLPVLAESLASAGYAPASEVVAVLCRAPLAEAEPAAPAGTRVLVYTDDPDSGGVAHYNHSLIMGLVAAGFRVACAQAKAENPLIAQQREAGVAHHWLPYDTKRDFARTLTEASDAQRILDAVQPGLVVFSDCCPLSNLAAREAARERGVPFVCVVGFVGAYLAERFSAQLPTLARHYETARAVVAVSEENLGLLRQHFGLPATAGQVVHYGRPERYFRAPDAATRARLRAELKLPDDAVVCFTAARLAAVKGYGYQLDAARALARLPEGKRLHFVWAGDGELRGELERTVAAAGLRGRVHLLGHRWDVAEWFDAADIFALPSDLEGMPLAIMEAMAKGVPVVATAVSGIPEELGDTGRLLPAARDGRAALVAQLARTLAEWTRDAALRKRIGEAGRRRAEAMFREATMVERTVALVRACAAAPAAQLAAA